MTMYKVIWEIDIDAEDPIHAAQLAHECQTVSDTTATCFTVIGDNRITNVDVKLIYKD